MKELVNDITPKSLNRAIISLFSNVKVSNIIDLSGSVEFSGTVLDTAEHIVHYYEFLNDYFFSENPIPIPDELPKVFASFSLISSISTKPSNARLVNTSHNVLNIKETNQSLEINSKQLSELLTQTLTATAEYANGINNINYVIKDFSLSNSDMILKTGTYIIEKTEELEITDSELDSIIEEAEEASSEVVEEEIETVAEEIEEKPITPVVDEPTKGSGVIGKSSSGLAEEHDRQAREAYEARVKALEEGRDKATAALKEAQDRRTTAMVEAITTTNNGRTAQDALTAWTDPSNHKGETYTYEVNGSTVTITIHSDGTAVYSESKEDGTNSTVVKGDNNSSLTIYNSDGSSDTITPGGGFLGVYGTATIIDAEGNQETVRVSNSEAADMVTKGSGTVTGNLQGDVTTLTEQSEQAQQELAQAIDDLASATDDYEQAQQELAQAIEEGPESISEEDARAEADDHFSTWDSTGYTQDEIDDRYEAFTDAYTEARLDGATEEEAIEAGNNAIANSTSEEGGAE